ncbi:PREDICTED: BRCA1-A complex subunit BRE-like [Acropora digitifera]|uniref:BRCA1-A complex subunit BRE-like n=1 Tax=Acropora digitifera TaxID=70779 RepID=UPI00077AAC5A|nr:PREDICTED: BRCA1-A complex subunit BRE-like [Acropora digitifera]
MIYIFFLIYSLSHPCAVGRTCDRFKVFIPYAGRNLKWEVIFDQAQPDFPPDFIFGPQDVEFIPNIGEIKSLENWNANDPLSLLKLIKELVTHYKEYQRKQVEDMPRIHFEYTTLAEDSKYPDFEVHVIKGQQVRKMGKFDNNCINLLFGALFDCPGEDMACLLVSYASQNGDNVTPKLLLSPRVERAFGGSGNLRIPHWGGVYGCLLEYLPLIQELFEAKFYQDCPGEDMACLLVSYASQNGDNVTPKLLLSPRVERAFGGSGNLRIPHWGGVYGCLLEYLPLIQELFEAKVYQVCEAYQKRREYVAAFLSAFGSSILEYDAEAFLKLSLLFQVQGFFCIVHSKCLSLTSEARIKHTSSLLD